MQVSDPCFWLNAEVLEAVMAEMDQTLLVWLVWLLHSSIVVHIDCLLYRFPLHQMNKCMRACAWSHSQLNVLFKVNVIVN
jgi:hypothetical protein